MTPIFHETNDVFLEMFKFSINPGVGEKTVAYTFPLN